MIRAAKVEESLRDIQSAAVMLLERIANDSLQAKCGRAGRAIRRGRLEGSVRHHPRPRLPDSFSRRGSQPPGSDDSGVIPERDPGCFFERKMPRLFLRQGARTDFYGRERNSKSNSGGNHLSTDLNIRYSGSTSI